MDTVDSELVTPVQAADFLAWLTNRSLSQGSLFHKLMRALTVPMAEKHFTYDGLIEFYKTNPPIMRAFDGADVGA